MTEFPFDLQLIRSNITQQRKGRYFSTLALNTEWSMACVWNSGCTGLEYLEISRKSKAVDIVVSGTFKLMRDESCLLQRKFSQLIETDYATTQIQCEYSLGHYALPVYSITGTISVSTGIMHKEYPKGINLGSLLELSSELERLLDPTATFADVELKCESASFSAHKNILSIRSPVFAVMFTTDMKEKQQNKVEIRDISPAILKTMLIYIYTGKTGELSVLTAGELLFAADEYQLPDLKRVCSDYLKSHIAVENVLNTLVLGYLHDSDLHTSAINFICGSCKEFEILEKTVEWKDLREKRPSLALDILTLVIKFKDEKLKTYS